ncbi:sialate O-acetylesterase [Puniceicoccus vermicola]|uniref:Right-handed parallel beta-helix repeat-containing protein n=1 Tax=Puniceicoccus vermicola TaxID=388746 RepID=A0A7X1B4L3_9BACT|nr:sialate O-acetylesterase [Puniceicoccus vermicola]MBC2604408.1 right-handed parallel beta-helix repeat-containing protein [Puniceicoccus vermicola]
MPIPKFLSLGASLLCLAISFSTGLGYAVADVSESLPSKDKFHLFLLAGQSNMAGRGKVAPEDKIPNPRILMLSENGEWVPAVDPIHFDKSIAGVGPGRSFAEAIADEQEDVVIGLIPAACGGSSITKWVPGGYHEQTKSYPYDDAVSRTKRAMQDGTLKGILWHQGEADVSGKRAANYEKNLNVLMNRFRTEFSDPNLPILVGQLGQFPTRPWNADTFQVDRALRDFAMETDYAGFVSSDGLTCKPDNTHFDAKSQREFGRRLAEAYLKLISEAHSSSGPGSPRFESGFEEALDGWVIDESEPMSSIRSEAAHNGDWGLRVEDSSTEEGSSVATPRLPAEPGQIFRFRFLARRIDGKGVGGYLLFYDREGHRIDSPDGRENLVSVNSRTWRDYSVVAVAPDGAVEVEGWLHSYRRDTSTTDFDTLRLEVYSPDMTPPWTPSYKLDPNDTLLTDADVPGPDGFVYPDWRMAGVSGGIPQLPIIVGVDRFEGHEGDDIATLLNDAVAEVADSGGGVVELPPGEFLLNRPVVIYDSGVVIRGAGQERTRLVFQDYIPYGEIRSRIWSPDKIIGPNGFFEIQANPKNLVELRVSHGSSIVDARSRKDHWGNRFFLRCRGKDLLGKLGPGTHTLKATIGYANGDTFSDSFSVTVSEDPQPGDRWLDQHAAIMVLGGGPVSSVMPLLETAERGSRQLKLASGYGLKSGDRLYIEAPATPRWNEITGNVSPWGTFRSNQLEVVSVDGDTVTVSQALRIDFPVEDGSFVCRIRTAEGVGIEDLTIEQKVFTQELVGPRIPETLWYPIEDLWTDGVTFCYAWNSWVSSVKIVNAGRNPLYFTRSKFCEVQNVEVFDSLFKGGGGTGYVGFERSYDCLMEDVFTRGMRHAPDLQWGSAGNVIRDSHFVGSDAQWHAGWTHENLFENNRIEQRESDLGQGTYGHGFFASGPSSTSHGPQGPRNVVYYNDVIAPKSGVTMLGGNEAWIIVYNRFVVGGKRGIYVKEKSFDHIIADNVFALPNGQNPAILVGAANCTGIEILDNRFYGPITEVASFAQGIGEFLRLENNRIFPLPSDREFEVPRPEPRIRSIFEWQRQQARMSAENDARKVSEE